MSFLGLSQFSAGGRFVFHLNSIILQSDKGSVPIRLCKVIFKSSQCFLARRLFSMNRKNRNHL